MGSAGIQTSISLIGYLIVVLGIGYWSSKKVENNEDFFIGGDKLPGFALGLSEESSNLSGWLLIGIPGLAYATGLSAIWVILGNWIGAILQWLFYSKHLMQGRKDTGAITPNDFIAKRFPGGQDMIRILGAITVFLFYIAYVGSQFNAGGKILDQTFGINPTVGMILVAVVITIYALAGGFITVVWTDAMQALLMLFTLVVLPLILLVQVLMDPSLSIMGSLQAAGGGLDSWFGGKTGIAAALLVGANMSWLFGLLGGEPHIFVRMMALNEEKQRKIALKTAIGWSTLAFTGAMLLGLLARAIHGSPAELAADREMVLPFMVLEHTPGIIGGILLAGALAAMMSTADSQLVMAGSAVAEDFYRRVLKKDKAFKESTRLRISRFIIVLLGILGIIFVTQMSEFVYTLVGWGWAGLAAAYAPIITLTIWWKRFNKAGVVAAFVIGVGFTIFWVVTGLDSIVTVRLVSFPVGFAAAIIATLLTSQPGPNPNRKHF